MKLPKVDIYSDWWARPNPWVGWYGVVMKYKWNIKEFSWFEEYSTNNRMELTGAIIGLEKLKTKSKVNLYTDSSYVVNWIDKWWAINWKENNWMRNSSDKVLNADLWERLLNIVEQHEVKFNWVRWHNGHEENERCDELATEQILKNQSYSNVENVKKDVEALDNESEIRKVLNENNDKSIKITAEWQACRKCGTKVEKKIPKKINKKNKSFYYRYYLGCPGCKTNYFVDDAKVML